MMTVLDLKRPSPLWTNRPVAPPDVRLAPMPPTSPLVGHLHLSRDPMNTFLGWRRDYGDIVRIRLGTLTAHLVSHPALVQRVMQDGHRVYGKRTRGMMQLKLLLGEGLLTSEGAHWLRQRRIAQPAFHKKRIAKFGDVMAEAGERIGDELVAGEAFDVNDAMMRATLDVVAQTMFGAGVTKEEAAIVSAAVDVASSTVRQRLANPLAPPLQVPTRANRRFVKHRDALDKIIYRIIRARRADAKRGAPARDDLLSLLMNARDPDTGQQMTDEQLRDEALTIFLAGHETTANALTWTFYLLSKSPGIARRLWAELDEVLDGPASEGGRVPTMEDVPRLAYTRQVIDESMRLFPPAWMNARAPIQDEELDGYFIPKGSLVFISPYVVHRHPEFWDDPEGFDPSRFAKGAGPKHRFAYFPFGGGPRLCIGQRFALVESVLMLAAVARRWRLDLVSGHPIVLQPAVTLRPKYGVHMVARAR